MSTPSKAPLHISADLLASHKTLTIVSVILNISATLLLIHLTLMQRKQTKIELEALKKENGISDR